MIPAAMINAIPLPVMVVATDGQITSLNLPAQELLGAQVVGRTYPAVLRQPGLIDRVERTLEADGRDTIGQPVRYLASEAGREVSYDAHVTPIDLPDGGVMICFIDATHKEQAGQMRSDFVANVSHELRTPLTALSGFIETLRGPARNDAEARDRFLGIMEHEAARMNRLVADLLSLSRVEDMERQRPTAPLVLKDLLVTIMTNLAPRAQSRDVDLTLSFELDDTLTLPGDRDQLIQVFTNLIENAIKYGREGGQVRLHAFDKSYAPRLRGPAICVAVEDEGEGISPFHIGRLTERFYRIDNHRSREMGGTGLGLAIVKHIVNRHRGQLLIESELGQGSRFTVSFPKPT